MKRCPYCAEEIQDAAVKCKHCGSILPTEERTPPCDPLSHEKTHIPGALDPFLRS